MSGVVPVDETVRAGFVWSLGDRIRKARRDKGLDQAQVAEHIGVSRALVSHWETNRSIPDALEAAELAELFDVSLDSLVRSRCLTAVDSPAYVQTELPLYRAELAAV